MHRISERTLSDVLISEALLPFLAFEGPVTRNNLLFQLQVVLIHERGPDRKEALIEAIEFIMPTPDFSGIAAFQTGSEESCGNLILGSKKTIKFYHEWFIANGISFMKNHDRPDNLLGKIREAKEVLEEWAVLDSVIHHLVACRISLTFSSIILNLVCKRENEPDEVKQKPNLDAPKIISIRAVHEEKH